MHRRISLTLLTLALVVPFTSSLPADELLTKKRDADEFFIQGRGTPEARNQKVEIWIGSDRVRRDDGATIQILRLDQKKLYLANRADRTYTVTDLHEDGGRWKAEGTYIPPKEGDIWHWNAKAEPSEETRKIGSWQATRYRIALSNEAGTAERIRLDWWIAPGLKLENTPLQTLLLLVASLSVTGDDWLATALALPGGYPVLYERVEKQPEVDVKLREELVSVQEKQAPAGTYDVPAGYKLLGFTQYMEANSVSPL